MAAMTGSLGLFASESGLTAALSVFSRLTARIRAHAVMDGHGILARSQQSDSERSTKRHQYSKTDKGEVETRWEDFPRQGKRCSPREF